MIEKGELFGKIAESLVADYTRVYLLNTKTNEYCRYFIKKDSHFLNEEQKGDDFFVIWQSMPDRWYMKRTGISFRPPF